jgi:hypothetical protein
VIAPGSQRPTSVADVTQSIVVPAILDRIFMDSQEATA